MRLRKLIGVEGALELVGGKLTLDSSKCWIDYKAVDRLLEKAETSRGASGVGYVEKADALYHGPFMLGEDAVQLAAHLSERLKERLSRNIGEAGRILEKSKEFKRATRLYKLGIEIDEFAEGFYHRLMLCYMSLGHKAKTVEVYKRLKKTLSINLGISPSDKIKDLYSSLLIK